MADKCEWCGATTDDLFAHKMHHAKNENLDMPKSKYGVWLSDGTYLNHSRNWSEPWEERGDN